MNRRRKRPANSDPPERSPMFALIMSAICESRLSSMNSGSGRAHASSPTDSAAARYSATAASSPITPVWRMPSATMIAPVSVATSMMTSGFSRLAATSPSAMTRRPSASVFSTSTV